LFTGLTESLGTLRRFADTPAGRHLHIDSPGIAAAQGDSIAVGDSVAVNGCCLTVAEISDSSLRFDLLHETLARTNLGSLASGSRVNLERALAANARLGGHFVQGHVDCTAAVLHISEQGPDLGLTFELPQEFSRYAVAKGSIAINGVSLTIAALDTDRFTVWIIPHTRAQTNLGDLQAGDRVNLEFDLLAKYTERLLAR
jgi:riboflavin synthase